MNEVEYAIKNGKKDIIKYFDRIHDKLLAINNIFIVAYLALISFKKDVSHTLLFIPMFNMLLLIYIDYRLMEKSRREANGEDFTSESVITHGKKIEQINLLSFVVILITIVESLVFVCKVS